MTDESRGESQARAAGRPAFSRDFERAVQAGLDLADLRRSIETDVARLLSTRPRDGIGRLVFTGSGDSHFAALAAVPALRRWSGIPATCLPAIEFSRYEIPLLGPDDVVVGVSNSGSAARTREAIRLARNRGNLTVGITGTADGPLASLAEVVIHRPIAALEDVDARVRGVFVNLVEYLGTLYAIYATGLVLAEHVGRFDGGQVEAGFDALEEAIRAVGQVALETEPLAADVAERLRDVETVWVIGAGPSWGSARYCAAKFHEQLPLNAIPEDLEEWAHLQYFLSLSWRERSIVFVLAPPGNSTDRAEELVEGIAGVGGVPIVVAHPGRGAFDRARHHFGVTRPESEWLSPITYHVPTQLVVLHLVELTGVRETPLRRQDDYWLIRHGVVRDDPHRLG